MAAAATHGGRVFALARRLGCPPGEILDFSASINPLGPPPGVLAAARQALAEIHHYPDAFAEPLVADLADYHRLPPGNLLAGAGATEFIHLVPRALGCRRAAIIEPAFGEYAVALQAAGCEIDRVALSAAEEFSLDRQALLRSLPPKLDLIILANPLNPVGRALPRAEIEALLDELPAATCLLLDEAFIDFCPEHSVLDLAGRRPNLLVLRSLTKFYAIPGLRAGYLAGPPALVARLQQGREPWRLSHPALAAARACLGEAEFRRITRDTLPAWRTAAGRAMTELGCQVFPSAANYLLCRLPEGSPAASRLVGDLASQGILVRACDDFFVRGDRLVRIAVRSPEDTRRLVNACRACCGFGGEPS